MSSDPLTENVQVAFTTDDFLLATREFLLALAHRQTQTFDLVTELRTRKLLSERGGRGTPGFRVPANDRAMRGALPDALGLLKVHFAAEARARIPAGVADQTPADGRVALAAQVQVLLTFVGVVPVGFGAKMPVPSVVGHASERDPNDAFQRVERRTGLEMLDGIRWRQAVAETHRVLVPVGVSEPHQQPPSHLDAESVNQFLPQQAHGRRAQNDDALAVQVDEPLIGLTFEQLGKLKVSEAHG